MSYAYLYINIYGFPDGSDDKESTCNVGDLDLNPGLGRSPGRVHGNPLQYSCLKSSHGQRSLARYNPRGHNESNTTEGLSTTIIDTADLNLPFCYLFPVLIPFLFLFSFGLNVFSKILVFEPICFLAIFFLYF